jgi:hypothetical protein
MCNEDSPLAVFNLEGQYAIPQGADWDVAILYKENNAAVDFSAATARAQVRKDYDKEIIMELNTSDATITLGDGANDTPNVVLKFTSGVTSALTSYSGIYDLEVTLASGLVKKFLEGKWELRREVTK